MRERRNHAAELAEDAYRFREGRAGIFQIEKAGASEASANSLLHFLRFIFDKFFVRLN